MKNLERSAELYGEGNERQLCEGDIIPITIITKHFLSTFGKFRSRILKYLTMNFDSLDRILQKFLIGHYL